MAKHYGVTHFSFSFSKVFVVERRPNCKSVIVRLFACSFRRYIWHGPCQIGCNVFSMS